MQSINLGRVLLVAVAILVAVLGPILAYTLYPGEAGGAVGAATGVVGAEQAPRPRHVGVSFIEALRHGHYYRGMGKVTGVVVAVFPHGFILETRSGEYFFVIVPGCILVNGEPFPSRLLAEKLLGSRVTVRGHVFVTPHGPVVRALTITTGGRVLVIKPCHMPRRMPCPGPCWRRG